MDMIMFHVTEEMPLNKFVRRGFMLQTPNILDKGFVVLAVAVFGWLTINSYRLL